MHTIEKIMNFIVIRAVSLYGQTHIKKYFSKSKSADQYSEKMLMKLLKKNKTPGGGRHELCAYCGGTDQ